MDIFNDESADFLIPFIGGIVLTILFVNWLANL